MSAISLNGTWKLFYALEDKNLLHTLSYLRENGELIDAIVPGNVELDLFRSSKEPDPFYDENIYQFRKYEFYRWQFERDFDAPLSNDSRWELHFEGLNCFAEIYLNDQKVGESNNALIEHCFDITDSLRYGEKNRLTVLIRSALNEMRKMDIPALVYGNETGDFVMARMPASSFGWDIMGRFVSAGMWRGVSLREIKPTRIVDVYYATKNLLDNGDAHLHMRYRWDTDDPILDGYALHVHGVCGDNVFDLERPVGFVDGKIEFFVPNAKLWWPKGYGEASLYTVTLELKKDGVVLDSHVERIGIRKLRVELVNETGDEGEFKIWANGCPIFCKGTNWVPLDALHSRDADRVQAAHDFLEDTKCNIIRCWGGNVYEDHVFFDLCDERGMMVWQDFAMACASYSQSDEYASQIEEETVSVIKKLRNHPSILLWAGDNEVDEGLAVQGFGMPEHKYNVLTREVIPRAVRMHDPYRYYLPSSPYITENFGLYMTPEQHNWGARAYFKDDFYKHTTAHFISECGYHGCPSVASLREYIPEYALNHWLEYDVWKTHNTDYLPHGERGYNRIQLMQDQVDILFGLIPSDIVTFAKLSQISQAEAKKFFIERSRIKKWRRTGIIWWNMIDGWPQISDAVIDYSYRKKLAYYYIKRVQEPVAIMMDELVDWGHDVVLTNDTRISFVVKYRITDGDTNVSYLEGTIEAPANESIVIGNIRELAGRQKLYLITWEIDGKQYANHYISGYPTYDPQQMLDWVDKIAALPGSFEWSVE